MKKFIGFSGGKDSTATWLLALERGEEVQPVFCDTGHEHPTTYAFIDYVERELGPVWRIHADFRAKIAYRREHLQKTWEKTGVPQDRIDAALEALVPTGIPMLDLCMLRGRFASAMARFCTQELKVFPFQEQILAPRMRMGIEVEQWVGIRRDESPSRAQIKLDREWIDPGYWMYRPILDWTAEEVLAIHDKHGIKPNPLYLQGMGRVGCMPCLHSNKKELRQIAMRYPEQFARLRKWEKIVADCSKRGLATFFAQDKTPGDPDNHTRSNALAVKDWSMTKWGGKEVDPETQEDPPMCHSLYGLCE